MTIGERIRSSRKNIGLTIEELAKLVGISRATMAKYETGDVSIPLDRVQNIADSLEVSPSYLMGWSNEPSLFSAKLTKDENEVISFYRSIPADLRPVALQQLRALASVNDAANKKDAR